jgi:hypothetical protein
MSEIKTIVYEDKDGKELLREPAPDVAKNLNAGDLVIRGFGDETEYYVVGITVVNDIQHVVLRKA